MSLTLKHNGEVVYTFDREGVSPYNLLRVVLMAKFSEPPNLDFVCSSSINDLIRSVRKVSQEDVPDSEFAKAYRVPKRTPWLQDIVLALISSRYHLDRFISLPLEERRHRIEEVFYPWKITEEAMEFALDQIAEAENPKQGMLAGIECSQD